MFVKQEEAHGVLVRICPTFSVDLFVHLLPRCSSGRSQIYTEVPVSRRTLHQLYS